MSSRNVASESVGILPDLKRMTPLPATLPQGDQAAYPSRRPRWAGPKVEKNIQIVLIRLCGILKEKKIILSQEKMKHLSFNFLNTKRIWLKDNTNYLAK